MTDYYNKMTDKNHKMIDENYKMTNENKKWLSTVEQWITQNVKWLSSAMTESWAQPRAGSGGWSTRGRRDGQCGMKSGARTGTGSEGRTR
jgi:2',3'-cyclic-nucleotide 2'-phosphodiesterase (5'-nucleotidase family)